MAYADRTQLAEYVGESVSLPSETEQDRLLERASEYIDYVTLDRIDTDDDDHAEAAQKAVCAQVAYWMEVGEEVGSGPLIGSYAIGKLEMNFGGGGAGRQGTQQRLAPRARQYLFLAGLLYRGVGVRR